LDLPAEFSEGEKLLLKRFFPEGLAGVRANSQGFISTGVNVKAGEPIVDFELETGDMLFVDRFSYNFFPPKVGDPIIFRTRAIPGLTQLSGGVPDDKYYIKRLVGYPGDLLQIKDSTLYRNGEPIEGSPIFAKNSKKTPPYPGYEARNAFENTQGVNVPEKCFYTFGDNSPESLDSRYWGGMPMDQLVGRAVFIYYPFSERWGVSK
jgi:signal peptidase I